MLFATLYKLSLPDLLAMAGGTLEDTVSDADFLETLAAQKCFILPPWVVRASPKGTLTRITRLIYTTDGNLNKPQLLLALAHQLRKSKPKPKSTPKNFGPRFST